IAIRPGISPSARRSSLRPHSARPRSATLYGTRPAALAASYACIFSFSTVDIRSLSLSMRLRLHCCRRKQRGSLCIGISRQQAHPDIAESRIRQQLSDVFLGEPEPYMAHLLLVLLPLVRQHVDNE